MADEKFLANRLKYHTASRIATQTGEALAQALNVDGHIVTTNKVWASPQTAFINNINKANTDSVDATNDLVAAFKTGAVSGAFWNGGTVWTNENYPAVKLYENVPMTVVKGSDGGGKFQAYEILAGEDGESQGTIRIVDWIAPTAVADQTNGAPVAGYSGIPMYNGTALKLADTSKWAEAGGHYEFAYLAGMLTFEPGFTPQDKSSDAVNTTTGKTYITLTAFKYVGEYLDKTLNSQDTRLDIVEAQLGLGSTSTDESVANKIEYISGVVKNSEIAGSNAITVSQNKIIEKPEISLKLDNTSNAIAITADGLKSFLELDKVTETSGTTIQLKANGVVIDSFNLDIDKVVTSGAYIPSSEVLKLSFSSGNDVEIPVSALVDEYSAGSGITISDVIDGKNIVSVKRDETEKSEKFFYVDPVNGAGVSGVQAAIDLAAGSIVSSVLTIPESAEGFKYNTLVYTESGETAIVDVETGKIVDISEKNVNAITSTSPSDALTTVAAVTGYVEETTSEILPDAKKYADDNFLKEVEVSGAEALSITTKANNKQTVSLAISTQAGNAIVDAATGLYVQGYVAGNNITLSANADGYMTINGSNDYELPVATDAMLGGIKSGGDISVNSDGVVSVLEANSVKNALTFGTKSFNGTSALEITANDINALTSVSGSNAISVSSKSNDSQSISLIVAQDEKYLEITAGGLATKGIDDAISAYVDPKVASITSDISGLTQALSDEYTVRDQDDQYISGIVNAISGDLYTVSGDLVTVSGDLDKAEEDIADIKAELGLGNTGSGQSVADKINYISGVVSGSTISGEIKSLRSDLTTLDSDVDKLDALVNGLQIQKDATATEGYAASYRLTNADGSKTFGTVINIPKDQFLSGAAYDATTSALVLTFAINEKNADGFETTTAKEISIPASSFVHEYTAGNGIAFDATTASFKLEKDANADSKFLQIGADTIGLSGITDAINDATSGIVADVTTLKGDDQTSGSVLYAVRTKAQFADYAADGTAASGTIQYAIRSNTAAIAILNGDSTVEGSVDYKIAQYDNSIESLLTSISTLNSNIENGIKA